MKPFLILILALTSAASINAQSDKEYYKDAVDDCIKELIEQSNDAYLNKHDNELGKLLFDSLVNNCIKGKYLSNYTFTTYDEKSIQTDGFDKPILLLTSATWCAPCWGEIPALNKIAVEYADDIQLIVLFADQKDKLKKMAAYYDKRIILIPSINAATDKSSVKIAGFNHLLDYPAGYLIDKDKKILDLTRGAAYKNDKMTFEEANEFNLKKLTKFIEPILK